MVALWVCVSLCVRGCRCPACFACPLCDTKLRLQVTHHAAPSLAADSNDMQPAQAATPHMSLQCTWCHWDSATCSPPVMGTTPDEVMAAARAWERDDASARAFAAPLALAVRRSNTLHEWFTGVQPAPRGPQEVRVMREVHDMECEEDDAARRAAAFAALEARAEATRMRATGGEYAMNVGCASDAYAERLQAPPTALIDAAEVQVRSTLQRAEDAAVSAPALHELTTPAAIAAVVSIRQAHGDYFSAPTQPGTSARGGGGRHRAAIPLTTARHPNTAGPRASKLRTHHTVRCRACVDKGLPGLLVMPNSSAYHPEAAP
ncbi:hypothetical protein EON67_07765, partial [archaeon]